MLGNKEMLFEPISIASMQLKNRIIMAPMETRFATRGGEVTGRLMEYYATRARGGVGLVTVEATAVDACGIGWFHNLCVYDDRFIIGLSQLAEVVKASGAKISLQIFHAGRQASFEVTGCQPVAPSAIPCRGGEVPRKLTVDEIRKIVERFAEAAGRAKIGGFDAVTLHMAHGYLINQFLSPYSNLRTDEYGGDIAGRTKFAVEIVQRVRDEVGKDFPVLCRMSADEFLEGGLTLKETTSIARILESATVDAIDVSAGTASETNYVIVPLMSEPRGCLVQLAETIKRVVGVPVSAVGRINDPVLANNILLEGKANLVSMGRALIADPELPIKTLQGRTDDICPCIACNIGCVDRLRLRLDITCTTNPLVGREHYYEMRPAKPAKRILIVGGGPAGMEAAMIAALRGHHVTLCERGTRLGGEMNIAALPPHKDEIKGFAGYLKRQMEKLGVEVQLGMEVTARSLEELVPDVLLIATGAVPFIPEIEGVMQDSVVTAHDVLMGNCEVGPQVVVIGGGQVGCETAEFLAGRGVGVDIVEMLDRMAPDMSFWSREVLLRRLVGCGVKMLAQAKVTEIKGKTVIFDRGGIEERLENIDDVVLATGHVPRDNTDLIDWAEARGVEYHLVGDCVAPRDIMYAVQEAFEAASSV